VERENKVAAKPLASYTNIADDTDKASAWNKYSEGMPPDLFKLGEKVFVISNMSQLLGHLIVPLEISVGWRCDDQMYRLFGEKRKISGIAINQPVRGRCH
jgi:hypothetical protein